MRGRIDYWCLRSAPIALWGVVTPLRGGQVRPQMHSPIFVGEALAYKTKAACRTSEGQSGPPSCGLTNSPTIDQGRRLVFKFLSRFLLPRDTWIATRVFRRHELIDGSISSSSDLLMCRWSPDTGKREYRQATASEIDDFLSADAW